MAWIIDRVLDLLEWIVGREDDGLADYRKQFRD